MPIAAETSRIPNAHPRETGEDDLAYLRRLARLGPLVKDRHGILIAFSMEHLQHCLASEAFRQPETDTMALAGIEGGPLGNFLSSSLLYANGTTHRRRRTPLAAAFAHRLMEALRPRIAEVAEGLIAPLVGRGETDLLGGVASPLPAMMIAEIIGAPVDDVPRFSELVHSAVRALSVRSPAVMAEAVADLGRLAAYVDGLLAARREAPREDFLTAYLARTDGGDLSPEEMRQQIVTLVLAGADTTRLAIAATAGLLLEDPAKWEAFAADPEALAPGAAREGLRMEPVVGSLAQVVAEPVDLAGHRLSPGTVVGPSLVTALRDPAVYAEPDMFDLHRSDHPRLHPVFGAGAHRCLGEALARAEIEVALTVLARLAPHARLVGERPKLRGLGAVRGIRGALTVDL